MSLLDQAIERGAEGAFDLLARLVEAPSVVGSEQGALLVLEEELRSIGMETTHLPFAPGPVEDPRAGVAPATSSVTADRFQLLAATPGEGDLRLLLNGHVDVVPADSPELWTGGHPFRTRREDGWLYGRGAADMKSGFAIGALALRAVREVHPDLFDHRRLGLLAVVEEECTGNGTLRAAVDHGVLAPEVVLLEPTDLGILLGGVGVLWIDLHVVGSSAHAVDSHHAADAVELGTRLVTALRSWTAELDEQEPEPSLEPGVPAYNVNLGRVSAGDWNSSSPALAVLGVRIGFPRAWTVERAEAEVRDLVDRTAAADPDFRVPPRVVTTGLRARGYLQDPDSDLVRDLGEAHRDAHGQLPPSFSLGSTTDARTYLNDLHVPAVAFGAVTRDMHGIDERVELASVVAAARTLARFLVRRFTEGGTP